MGGSSGRAATLGLVLRGLRRHDLPAELEAVVRRAAGYAEDLTTEHANEPELADLDVYVGWGRARPWLPSTRAMSAFLVRYPEHQTPIPIVLEHCEPLVHKPAWRGAWQLVQTAEEARDKMARVLRKWAEAVH